MEINYQEIFNIIQELLPNDWKSVVFYAEYYEGAYMMKFYIKQENGKIIDCFDMGIPLDTIGDFFEMIDGIIEPEWKKLEDKWSNMTMVVNQNGEFKVDFGYEDFPQGEGYSKFLDEWYIKYLGINRP